jgi:hypothetical protein
MLPVTSEMFYTVHVITTLKLQGIFNAWKGTVSTDMTYLNMNTQTNSIRAKSNRDKGYGEVTRA